MSHRGPGALPIVRHVQPDVASSSRQVPVGPTLNYQQNMYDQRSMQVQVGVDPQQVLQMQSAAIEHVQSVEQQAIEHVRTVEGQAGGYVEA